MRFHLHAAKVEARGYVSNGRVHFDAALSVLLAGALIVRDLGRLAGALRDDPRALPGWC